jgi:hypothetical protein
MCLKSIQPVLAIEPPLLWSPTLNFLMAGAVQSNWSMVLAALAVMADKRLEVLVMAVVAVAIC